MRNFFLLVALLPCLAFGQVSFLGDSVKIEMPVLSNAIDFSVQIQNAYNLSESVTYWSDSGNGQFYAPWCNVRVSRTSFDADLVATQEWCIDLQKVNASIKVASMPNRKALVTVDGGNYDIRFRHIAYGGNYVFYQGFQQYYPTGSFEAGSRQFFIPYRVHGLQVATVTVHAQGCSQTVSRLFHLN